jgi:hypothetical protein
LCPRGENNFVNGHGTNLAHPGQCLLHRGHDRIIVKLPKSILRVPQHVNNLERVMHFEDGSGGFNDCKRDGEAEFFQSRD